MKLKLKNKEAIRLKKLDLVLGKAITQDLEKLESRGGVYEGLLRAIISQQISTSAATAVRNKVLVCFGGELPSPQLLLKTKDEVLRSCGLSRQKISYFKNVAQHFVDENLNEKDFNKMSDQEIIDDLTKIKGVGQWTVEMLLIFNLLRPDIFSYKDLGLVTAIYKLYSIDPKKYKPKNLKIKILKIAENWKPYRSLACRYLWNYKDGK
jgi:DNA-3-methyladenine glycosylase II